MITTEIKRDCVYKQRSDVPSHSKLFSSVLQWRLENRFEGEDTVRSVQSLAEARDGLLESMTGGVD